MTPTPPPVQETSIIAGAAGGFVLAMASTFEALFGAAAPTVITRLALFRALALAACSWLAGVFGAAFVAPAICLARGITQGQFVSLIGFVVGSTFWTLIPAARFFVAKWVSRQTGVELEAKAP